MTYKSYLADALKNIVEQKYGKMDTILTCCFDTPSLAPDTCVITPCPTCAERYAKIEGCTSICFLNDLAEMDYPFPDYKGIEMSIQDTCAARKQADVLSSVRTLLRRMNINIVEPQYSGSKSRCCGQVLYGKVSEEKVIMGMQRRAQEMPCNDVVVYCSSCIMSMTVGGRSPRFILDLLFNEETEMKDINPIKWNTSLANFRLSHTK